MFPAGLTQLSAWEETLASLEELPAEDTGDDEDLELSDYGPIDPPRWRQLILKMQKEQGDDVTVILLRPVAWLEAVGADRGATIDLDLEELGAVGPARVLFIEPCPPIAKGAGRVVTGKFIHQAANIVDVKVEGQSEPIGTTSNHPFWSEDRQSFIPAGDLHPGERLRTLNRTPRPTDALALQATPRGPPSTARVLSITPRRTTHTVYNLEVDTEHVYNITPNGVLVHNAYAPHITGQLGEQAAMRYLQQKKFKEFLIIKNNSGHGVDILARKGPNSPWVAFEVKATRGDVAGQLSVDQAKGASWYVRSRLTRAAEDTHSQWKNVSPQMKAQAKDVLAQMRTNSYTIKGAVINVTGIGSQQGPTIVARPWR